MKKTLTVNLGGIVYNIDEDAYRLLDNYLKNLRLHFRKQQGAEEIVNDIEIRIAELFSEQVTNVKQVIAITDVEEIISRVGKPEDFGDEDDEAGDSKKKSHSDATGQNGGQTTAPNRRLYRDPDNRMLGGVAAGLAAYLGWDITLVRVLMVILVFIPYCPMIILYLIAWIVTPEACTAAQKLNMRGQAVTVENIGKTVTDGFERVAKGMNDYVNANQPRTFLQKVADIFVNVIALLFKIILVITAIILCPFLFIAAIVLITILVAIVAVLIGAGTAIFSLLPELPVVFGSPLAWDSPWVLVSCIVFILFIGIPIFTLVYTILRSVFNWQPMAKGIRLSLLITWLITLPLLLIFLVIGWFTPMKCETRQFIRREVYIEEPATDPHTIQNEDTIRIDSLQH